MSIKVGTNFNYQGHDFLDSRQSIDSIEELKSWDTLVPLGFEACVDGEWYTWKGEDYWNDTTGHWEKRSAGMGTDYDEAIAKLMAKVFPATFSVSGGGTYEKGQSLTPTITWSLRKEGYDVTDTITSVSIGKSGEQSYVVSSDPPRWSPASPITSNTTYNISATTSEGASYSGSATYTFLLKKYWGVHRDPLAIESLFELQRGDDAWASDWKLGSTTFDCTGGMYPVYIIPYGLYNPSTFQIWISGIRNTDFSVYQRTFTNSKGSSDTYAVIKLDTIQTGILSIKFTNNS